MANNKETPPKTLTFVKDNGEVIEYKAPSTTKKKKAERTRKFCLITYIDRSAVECFCKSAEWVQHWAMCTHDRDTLEDGTPKERHTHILLYTYDGKTSSAVKKIFDNFSQEVYRTLEQEPQNTLVQACHDMAYQWRYLIHADDTDKAQYEQIERICDDTYYWTRMARTQGLTASDSNSGLSIVRDMLGGASTISLVERYGKDFIYHMEHYRKVCSSIVNEEFRSKKVLSEDFSITKLFALMLENSTFSEKDIQHFFVMLDFIKAECGLAYDSNINFYLEERKTK